MCQKTSTNHIPDCFCKVVFLKELVYKNFKEKIAGELLT